MVTNRKGIALGLYHIEDVERKHAQLQLNLAAQGAKIGGFYICPHGRDACKCRKPLTGLFDQGEATFPEIRPEASLLVGDSLSDIEFGRNVGMSLIFVNGQLIDNEGRNANSAKVCRFRSLSEAVDALLDSAIRR